MSTSFPVLHVERWEGSSRANSIVRNLFCFNVLLYYLDTEFIECAKQRTILGIRIGQPVPTIDLISIGIVAEDGRMFYALNADCELAYAWQNEWVRENVLHPIYKDYYGSFEDITPWTFSLRTMQDLFQQNGMSRADLADAIEGFVKVEVDPTHYATAAAHTVMRSRVDQQKAVFYGYYCDYDWVVFCQLFGRMIGLPKHFPQYCQDLKQEMDRLGMTSEEKRALLPDPVLEHNALVDAKWNREFHAVLCNYAARP